MLFATRVPQCPGNFKVMHSVFTNEAEDIARGKYCIYLSLAGLEMTLLRNVKSVNSRREIN